MAVNQLKGGAVLSLLSFGAANILGLLYTPFMLRMMGQEEYGLYSLVASVVSYLTILDFGFGNAIVRYTAKYRAEGREDELSGLFGMFAILYGMVGLVALLLGLGMYFNIDTLFGTTMTDTELGKMHIMMALLVLNVVFTFVMSVWRSIPVAYERFIYSKSVNLARMILNPLVMVVLLYMGYRAIALVVVITVFNVIVLCTDAWYCKSKLRVKIAFVRFRWKLVKEVSLYSFWIFVGVIVERIYWGTGQFILGIYVGSAAVAVYAVAVQLACIYMSLGSFMWSMFLPKVTKMASDSDNRAISDLFVRSSRIQYILLLSVLIVYVVFGKDFIVFWAGKEYENVYIITLMFFASLLFPYTQNMGAVVSQARNSVRPYALIRLITSLFGLFISICLTLEYQDIGCALGVSFALLVQTVALNIYYYRYLQIDIPRFWKEVSRVSGLPALFCLCGSYVIKGIEWDNFVWFIGGIMVFVMVYMVLSWYLILNDYERNLIIRPLSGFKVKD